MALREIRATGSWREYRVRYIMDAYLCADYLIWKSVLCFEIFPVPFLSVVTRHASFDFLDIDNDLVVRHPVELRSGVSIPNPHGGT